MRIAEYFRPRLPQYGNQPRGQFPTEFRAVVVPVAENVDRLAIGPKRTRYAEFLFAHGCRLPVVKRLVAPNEFDRGCGLFKVDRLLA